MKHTQNISFILICLMAIFFLSCGGDNPVDELSRKELLLGSWKLQSQNITSVTYTFQGQSIEVPEAQFNLIESQFNVQIPKKVFSDSTVITFDTDNSYTIYDPQANDSVPGTWAFNEMMDTLQLSLNEDIINIPLNSNQASGIIEELTTEVLAMLLVVEDMELQGNEFGGKIRLNFNKE